MKLTSKQERAHKAQGPWDFIVLGPLVGAVRTTQRAKWVDPRYQRYAVFKMLIRALADKAGVPSEIPSGHWATVSINVLWLKGARCDLDNLVKSVLDGLWKQDRMVLEIRAQCSLGNARYVNVPEEQMRVRVEIR